MARAKMREVTLLGLYFCVPLGYTLLARVFHRYIDDLTVDVDEEFRLGKTSEPIVNLLVRQRREVLAICQCAADEECSGDGIIDFSIHLSLRALAIQSVSYFFVVLICHFFAYLEGMLCIENLSGSNLNIPDFFFIAYTSKTVLHFYR